MIEAVKHVHEVIGSGSRKGEDMKVFVTGVGGQLGHDVVNELDRRSNESVASDIQRSIPRVDGTVVLQFLMFSLTSR